MEVKEVRKETRKEGRKEGDEGKKTKEGEGKRRKK